MAEGDAMVVGIPLIIISGFLAASIYIILDKYLKDVFAKLDTSTTLLILFLAGLLYLAVFAIFIKILSEIDDC